MSPRRLAAILSIATITGLAGCASHAYQPGYVNGTVSLQQALPLPPATTTVRVRLLDASGDVSSLLGEQTLEKPARFPLAFSLCYDKQAVKTGGRYVIQSQVYVDGELRLQNAQPVEAFKAEHPEVKVELIR